jgi:hypothetical protein
MYSRGRTGAIGRRIEWALSREDVAEVLRRSGGLCEISGLPFSDERHGKRGVRPWMATLDRVDAAAGYMPGNVRVVCLAANNALADFGDAVLITLAKAVAGKLSR